MHSSITALAWQHWWRHRLGLALVLLCLLGFAALFQFQPFGRPQPAQGYLTSLLFVVALLYVVAVFAFGFETKLETRESCYPARTFTLPVRTVVLVGWPMLQGMAAVTVLWTVWVELVLLPTGIEPAWWVRILVPAAGVAVLQALIWLPFGVDWLRVVLAV